MLLGGLFYFLHHSSVPSAKDKRQEELKQQEKDTTRHARNPEESLNHKGNQDRERFFTPLTNYQMWGRWQSGCWYFLHCCQGCGPFWPSLCFLWYVSFSSYPNWASFCQKRYLTHYSSFYRSYVCDSDPNISKHNKRFTLWSFWHHCTWKGKNNLWQAESTAEKQPGCYKAKKRMQES